MYSFCFRLRAPSLNKIVPANAANASYTGTVILAPEPPHSGRARYTQGDFTFATQKLTRSLSDSDAAGEFYRQAGEPRVVHDAAGNIYIAGIQAAPAGTEVWKSADGGATFSYLGEPGGADASAIAAVSDRA